MKIGIMQPYLFPYIGYFQLIKCVDLFVLYDDVQYINRGWINRNRLLNNGQPLVFTMSLKKDSSHLAINQRYFSAEFESEKQKLIKTLCYLYAKAPHFKQTLDLIRDIFTCPSNSVSDFINNQIAVICEYLGIRTPRLLSSSLNRDRCLKGEQAIIDIVNILEGKRYINPIGGMELYSKESFEAQNLQLNFLKTSDIIYNQFKDNEFVSNLSIIDVLMFNSKDKVNEMLQNYKLF